MGTTRNDLQSQWKKMVSAAKQNLDFPLYREIRCHGNNSFIVEEYDWAETKEELIEIEKDALTQLNARSLRGYKTSTSTIKVRKNKASAGCDTQIESQLASILREADESAQLGIDPEDMLTYPETEPCEKQSSELQYDTDAAILPDTAVSKKEVHNENKAESQPENRPAATEHIWPDETRSGTSNWRNNDVTSDKKIKLTVSPETVSPGATVKNADCNSPDGRLSERRPQRNRQIIQLRREQAISENLSRRQSLLTAAVDAVLAGSEEAALHLDAALPCEIQCAEGLIADSNSNPQLKMQGEDAGNRSEEGRDGKTFFDSFEQKVQAAIARSRHERSNRCNVVRDNERKKIKTLMSQLEEKLGIYA